MHGSIDVYDTLRLLVALGSPSFEQWNELKFKVGTKEVEKTSGLSGACINSGIYYHICL
jgi:hypothetical protein